MPVTHDDVGAEQAEQGQFVRHAVIAGHQWIVEAEAERQVRVRGEERQDVRMLIELGLAG